MDAKRELLDRIAEIHTTELGAIRIRRNLALDAEDPVEWCETAIRRPDSKVERRGKNWYIRVEDCVITVNSHSCTIITAHRKKSEDR